MVALTSVCENPNGHFASRADLICLPDTPDRRKWADGIGNIVGTVTETRDSGGHTRLDEVSSRSRFRAIDRSNSHLEEGIQMFSLVVVMGNMEMDLGKILCEEARGESFGLAGRLFLDNVSVDSTEEVIFGASEKSLEGLRGVLLRLEFGHVFH